MRLFAKKNKKTSTQTISKKIQGSLGYDEIEPGLPDLEFMSELAPPDGLEKYRRMERNDPIIGGLILRIRNILSRINVDFSGQNVELVKTQLETLPGGTNGLISSMTSAITYGFYIGEMIWGVEGGKIILKDIEPRFQTTIENINDENGNVVQETSSESYEIPYNKCLHHIFIDENRSPYGVSLLRHLYKPYYYKVSCEAAEAVGIDRDLSGLPVLEAPEGFNFSAADSDSPDYDASVAATINWAVDLVGNIRKDSQQGVVVPFGWKLSLIRGDGTSSINTTEVIHRYNSEMAAGLLEMFMALGSGSASSRGNIEAHIRDFLLSCDSYAKSMENTINTQVIPKICQYNGLDSYPKIQFSTTNVADLAALASFVGRLVKNGVITPTIPMEKALLAIADLPYDDDEKNKKEVL